MSKVVVFLVSPLVQQTYYTILSEYENSPEQMIVYGTEVCVGLEYIQQDVLMAVMIKVLQDTVASRTFTSPKQTVICVCDDRYEALIKQYVNPSYPLTIINTYKLLLKSPADLPRFVTYPDLTNPNRARMYSMLLKRSKQELKVVPDSPNGWITTINTKDGPHALKHYGGTESDAKAALLTKAFLMGITPE